MARSNTERRHELLEKIAKATAKMRHHQRNFFRTKKREEMQEAVLYESIVDGLLADLDRVTGYVKAELPGQAGLFD